MGNAIKTIADPLNLKKLIGTADESKASKTAAATGSRKDINQLDPNAASAAGGSAVRRARLLKLRGRSSFVIPLGGSGGSGLNT